MSSTGGGRSADLVRLYGHPTEVCHHPAGRGDVYRTDACSQPLHLISPAQNPLIRYQEASATKLEAQAVHKDDRHQTCRKLWIMQ